MRNLTLIGAGGACHGVHNFVKVAAFRQDLAPEGHKYTDPGESKCRLWVCSYVPNVAGSVKGSGYKSPTFLMRQCGHYM